MKIGNVGQIHRAMFGKRAQPTWKTWEEAEYEAKRKGKAIAWDGRFYIPTARFFDSGRPNMSALTPAGMRWQGGKLIPRYAHRHAARKQKSSPCSSAQSR